jgi:DNA-binding CsgD family transcriptional regulator
LRGYIPPLGYDVAEFPDRELGETIEALGTDSFYRNLARYLRRCITYDNVIVIVFQGTAVPAVLYKKIYGPDVFRYVEQQYLPAAYILDPIYHMHLNRHPPGLYRLLDVAPDNFRRSRYFKWYYGRIGITDEISVVLPLDNFATLTISMGRDSSSGKLFSTKAERMLRKCETTIMALLKAHWRLGQPPIAYEGDGRSIIERLKGALQAERGVALSRRQAEVALLILRGHSSPSIGLHLGISPQTVKVFRRQLYEKCDISSQGELFGLMMPILDTPNAKGKYK